LRHAEQKSGFVWLGIKIQRWAIDENLNGRSTRIADFRLKIAD
jgi:hypothetical protein